MCFRVFWPLNPALRAASGVRARAAGSHPDARDLHRGRPRRGVREDRGGDRVGGAGADVPKAVGE